MLADIGVLDGMIRAIAPDLPGGHAEIDARDLEVLPGVIDAHVHLNDPGRAHWEGFDSGTLALAAGGTTTFADMPLNCIPATTSAEGLRAKLAAVAGRSHVDYVLWGGLVPGNHAELAALAGGGVCGFKAFLSGSGVAEFARADDLTLFEGMVEAARLGLPVAVHAESEEITAALTARAVAGGERTMRAYIASRPAIAEIEAVARALLIAEEAACAVHLCHLSTARAVALVVAARARGVRATCETCPHYLLLTDTDAEEIGALAKCAPPVRSHDELRALGASVARGEIDMFGSDHSPAPIGLKHGDDMFAVWGGIAGAQTLLTGTLTAGVPLASVPRLLGLGPADLLGVAGRKGALQVGGDADLVVLDGAASGILTAESLHYRHPQAALVGRTLQGRVMSTLLRGRAAGPGHPPSGRHVARRRSR